jgi:hypothetical protein
MGWEGAKVKFDLLSERYLNKALRKRIIDTVANLEQVNVTALTKVLATISTPKARKRKK